MKALLLSLPFFAATALSTRVAFTPSRFSSNVSSLFSQTPASYARRPSCSRNSRPGMATPQFIRINHASYSPMVGKAGPDPTAGVELRPCEEEDFFGAKGAIGNVTITVDPYPIVAGSDVVITYSVQVDTSIIDPTLTVELLIFGGEFKIMEVKLCDLLKLMNNDTEVCPIAPGFYTGSVTYAFPKMFGFSSTIRVKAVESDGTEVFCYETDINVVKDPADDTLSRSSGFARPAIYRARH